MSTDILRKHLGAIGSVLQQKTKSGPDTTVTGKKRTTVAKSYLGELRRRPFDLHVHLVVINNNVTCRCRGSGGEAEKEAHRK